MSEARALRTDPGFSSAGTPESSMAQYAILADSPLTGSMHTTGATFDLTAAGALVRQSSNILRITRTNMLLCKCFDNA
jgi:D-alanyl-D-alanine dipeptidase